MVDQLFFGPRAEFGTKYMYCGAARGPTPVYLFIRLLVGPTLMIRAISNETVAVAVAFDVFYWLLLLLLLLLLLFVANQSMDDVSNGHGPGREMSSQ